MTPQQWFEQELVRKLRIIDVYLTDVVKNNEVMTFLWHEPVISDWEPEDYDSPLADRHFQKRILNHLWSKWKQMRVEVFSDSIRVSSV